MHSKPFFIRTVSKAWPRVLAVYISVLEWWANKTVGNKTGSACPYQSICSVPIQWEGSNLHVKQNQFIAILRNLYREEKSLCHVHMAAKFLDDNNTDNSLKK